MYWLHIHASKYILSCATIVKSETGENQANVILFYVTSEYLRINRHGIQNQRLHYRCNLNQSAIYNRWQKIKLLTAVAERLLVISSAFLCINSMVFPPGSS